MDTPVYYLVSIFIHPGMGGVLKQYERHAVQVMRRHGGQFLHVLQPVEPATNELPDEIHLLAFTSATGFAAFQHDPELQQYGHLREAAVHHVDVTVFRAVPLAEYFHPVSSTETSPR